MSAEDMSRRFTHYPPHDEVQAAQHGNVRAHCKHLAFYLDEVLPDSREKSLAITHLEETMMWANAALARSRDA